MNPIVSIITASYNKVKFISETIESVIKQTFQDWELLIIDDASIDGTIEIVENFVRRENRIKLITNEENKGANFCRNVGIRNANGKYIVFLDADDLLTSTCIENRVNVIENNSSDFCVFSMGVFYKQIGDASFIWKPKSKKTLDNFLQHILPWTITQPIWKRELLLSCQGFDERFSRLQDVELNTRILLIPSIKYTLHSQYIDSYYRIDNSRKNFNQYEFLKRWVKSALMYYDKFHLLMSDNKLKRKLLGTIYKTHIQILHSYKLREITKLNYIELEDQLLNSNLSDKLTIKNRFCFKLSTHINLLPFRVPGVNYVLSKLVIL